MAALWSKPQPRIEAGLLRRVEPPRNVRPGSGEEFPVPVDVQNMVAPPGSDVPQNRARFAVDLHVPAVRLVRLVAVLRPNPKRAGAIRHRRNLPEVIPLAQVLPVQIKSL